ncbi:TraG family conjugative transposon ATPase [Flavitalea flava]
MKNLFSEIQPLLEVTDEGIISKTGAMTICLEIFLPEIFTGTDEALEKTHQGFIKSLKVLKPGTIFHKQDWYTHNEYAAPYIYDPEQENFLSTASNRLYNQRNWLEHRSFIFLTRLPAGRTLTQPLSGSLLKKTLVPEDTLDPQAMLDFETTTALFIRILLDNGISCTRLSEDELISSSGNTGLIENYCTLLNASETPTLQDIRFNPDFRIGDQYVRIFTLADAEHLPNQCSVFMPYIPYSTENTPMNLGFGALLGLLLNFPHIYNQYILIEDQPALIKKLELKGRRHQNLSIHSRINAQAKEAIDSFLTEAISQHRIMVKAHFNIQISSPNPAEIKDLGNKVSSAIAAIGATPHPETVAAPLFWWAGIPGNAADLPIHETIDTFAELAACFLASDTNANSSSSPFGIRLGDRLTGRPLHVDISDEPIRNNKTKNRNKFVVGGSGSGKSVFINHLLRNYYELSAHIVVIDIGNSYQGLCSLLGGLYFAYTEKTPICFNPFWLPPGDKPDIEKKESIKALLVTLWKMADETMLRSEYVALSNAMHLYYEHLAANPELFPCFNTFYEFLRDQFVEVLATDKVKEKDFDMQNFLYVLRPFYTGGEYDFLLNSRENMDLLQQRFIVFELDQIKDHILFPVVTIIIAETFLAKMRKLPGIRKVILIEEAWKAISRQGMSEYIKYLFKTVRKFFGEAIVVTQEIDDLISSPVVKQAIINNSDCKILLDMSKFRNKFEQIAETLGLTEKDKALVLSLNQSNDPSKKYKEVFISLGPDSKVYRVELSLEEYLVYTTEESEKLKVQEYTRSHGNIKDGIIALARDIRNGSTKLLLAAALVGLSLLFPSISTKAQIPIVDIIMAGVKKVIVATDLEIQRLQTQTLFLQNTQKAVENTMQELQLGEITGWVQQQKDLYEQYYQELWSIKNSIAMYQRLVHLVNQQDNLLQDYKKAVVAINLDKHFTRNEADRMLSLYGRILDESIRNVKDLVAVVKASITRMDDAERLSIIDKTADAVEQNYSDLKALSQKNFLLSQQRAKTQAELVQLRYLYGI